MASVIICMVSIFGAECVELENNNYNKPHKKLIFLALLRLQMSKDY